MSASYCYKPAGNKVLRRRKKILLWFLAMLFIAGFFYAAFFAHKFYFAGKKISVYSASPSFIQTVKNIAAGNPDDLRSSSKNRINILLLGIAGEGKPGQYLTDTIMIASLDLEKKKVALLSLPRDLYAEVPSANLPMKINSIYQFGINTSENIYPVEFSQSGTYSTGVIPLKKTIEEITSLKMDYFAVLNFDGFEKIIDSIGGINITNERDIFDSRYPGPNYSYETFELAKGFHHLDGATALKYARVRHGDPEGDFGRAKRQQQVLQAVKNKIFSIGTLLNPFALNGLLNDAGNNILTDISPNETGDFLELFKKLDTQNIINVVADAWNKDSLLKVSHVYFGETRSFILVPRMGNWSELQDLAENIFELDKIKKRQAAIENEQASVVILNRSGDRTLAEKIKLLVKDKLKIPSANILTEKEKTISAKTIVTDNTGGKKLFTLDELLKKLGARLDKDGLTIVNLQQESDFVIILGQDLAEAHNFEEDSVEEYNLNNQ